MESRPIRPEEVLNLILPPREWVEQGKHFVQYVSHIPSSRVDVARLRELLDTKLQERQARDIGLCPVREELFGQCFDEIIRQVTLDQPERGLLLMRVRNDIEKTNAAYKTLYQSSVTFAMRKQLQAEHGKQELLDQIKELEDEKKRNLNCVIQLKTRIEAHNRRNKERVEVDLAKRAEEMKFLNFQRDHLTSFLKQIQEK